jgi:hypothetical protein
MAYATKTHSILELQYPKVIRICWDEAHRCGSTNHFKSFYAPSVTLYLIEDYVMSLHRW